MVLWNNTKEDYLLFLRGMGKGPVLKLFYLWEWKVIMAKILIVDDEDIARLTLAEILRLEGYEIKSVSNGEAAVEALRCEPFDVMILDLKMAGMSGMDVLQAVVDDLPDLSVIVLTAYGTIDTAIQAIRYQVHDYLLKPVSPEQVLESIENALDKKQSAQHSIQ